MKGVFVTGTDTGIGKTLVSAWLVRSWDAEYWKPIQSGCDEDSDAETVRALAPGAVIHPSTYLLKAPLSPHEAARLQGVSIELAAFKTPLAADILVVEGAGGALVPLTDDALMVDLMVRLGFPALVVARSGLGTINHVLLTLEALRGKGVPILGVVMNGPPDAANKAAIERYGKVAVLAETPRFARPEDLLSFPAAKWRP